MEVDHQCLRQIPLHHLGALVLFGNVMISPHAMHRCVSEGREITFLDHFGRFRCRVEGPAHGNILLRLAQFEAARDEARAREIARRIVAAKIRNSRGVLLRGARDAGSEETRLALHRTADGLTEPLEALPDAGTLDEIRGHEGNAAAQYFGVFGQLITTPTAEFAFTLRTRRPPRDRVNALLSFLYAMVTHDCTAAVEGVGLDPQLGFLHAVRSGRPALRAGSDGRIPRRDSPTGWRSRSSTGTNCARSISPCARKPAAAWLLNDEGRKIVLTAYQKRKEEQHKHHILQEDVAAWACSRTCKPACSPATCAASWNIMNR